MPEPMPSTAKLVTMAPRSKSAVAATLTTPGSLLIKLIVAGSMLAPPRVSTRSFVIPMAIASRPEIFRVGSGLAVSTRVLANSA